MQWHESPLVHTDVVHTDVVSTLYLRPYCLAHEGSYRMKRSVKKKKKELQGAGEVA